MGDVLPVLFSCVALGFVGWEYNPKIGMGVIVIWLLGVWLGSTF